MAFLEPQKAPPQKPRIDLAGQAGNAFVLLGYARSLGQQLGFDKEEQKNISNEMREKDYLHLVKTFDHYFGDYVDLVLPPNWSWEEKEEPDPLLDNTSEVKVVVSSPRPQKP